MMVFVETLNFRGLITIFKTLMGEIKESYGTL